MTEQETSNQDLVTGAKQVIGHLVALVIGVVLMIAGVAMGVTLVLLPVGIPLGLGGLLLFLWGIFGWAREQQSGASP